MNKMNVSNQDLKISGQNENQLSFRTYKLILPYEDYTDKYKQSLASLQIGRYYIQEREDEGKFGDVYKGFDIQEKRVIAAKLIDFHKIQKSGRDQKVIQMIKVLLKREWGIMGLLSSKHIVKIYDFFENDDLKIIIMEYCNQGTLYNQIYNGEIQDEEHAIEILKQLVKGISVMHEKYIIHRDLKSNNIMCHNKIYKIIDFGASRQIQKNIGFVKTNIGTTLTKAPQILEGKNYGLKADIWSLGIIFYEIIYMKTPYKGDDEKSILKQIYQKDIFSQKANHSPKVLQLLKLMLQIDPADRIDWNALISHQIFNKVPKDLPEIYRPQIQIGQLKLSTQKLQKLKTVPDALSKIESQIQQNLQNSFQSSKTVQVSKEKTIYHHIDTKIPLKIVQKYFMECKKTQWIYKHIFMEIKKWQLFEIEKPKRQTLELMYLLISRCYLNMSFIREDIDSGDDKFLFTNFKDSVNQFYKTIETQWNKYSKKLREKQNQIFEIFFDKFRKLANKEEEKIKQMFLTGNQISEKYIKSEITVQKAKHTRSRSAPNVIVVNSIQKTNPNPKVQQNYQIDAGFTRQQQINYTFHKYITKLLVLRPKKKKSQHALPRKKARDQVLNCLSIYQQVNALVHSDLHGKKFTQKILQILNQ